MELIIILLMFFICLMPIAIIGNIIGEHIATWLEKKYPNVEE